MTTISIDQKFTGVRTHDTHEDPPMDHPCKCGVNSRSVHAFKQHIFAAHMSKEPHRAIDLMLEWAASQDTRNAFDPEFVKAMRDRRVQLMVEQRAKAAAENAGNVPAP